MTVCIELSAGVRLFVEEAEAQALAQHCDDLRASDVEAPA